MFRSRIRVYTVHINPKLAKPYEEAKFIEEGFNVTAFFFAPLWLLYYRLWWPFFALCIAMVAIMHMGDSGMLSEISKGVLHFAIHLFIGFEGNDWRRKKLARAGNIMTDIVSGDSLVRAEQRFYDHYFAHSAA